MSVKDCFCNWEIGKGAKKWCGSACLGDAHGLDGWAAGRDCLHLCFGLSQAGGAGSMYAGLCGYGTGMGKFSEQRTLGVQLFCIWLSLNTAFFSGHKPYANNIYYIFLLANPLNTINFSNNTKNHYCELEVAILLGRYMIACVQYALPYEWNNWTTQTSFLRSGFYPLKQMLCRKNDGEA